MKYLLTCGIKEASGHQCWTVDADSPEDALAKFKAGEGDFYAEEVEVTSLDEPDIAILPDEPPNEALAQLQANQQAIEAKDRTIAELRAKLEDSGNASEMTGEYVAELENTITEQAETIRKLREAIGRFECEFVGLSGFLSSLQNAPRIDGVAQVPKVWIEQLEKYRADVSAKLTKLATP
jgi:chromosome segregation ATPase